MRTRGAAIALGLLVVTAAAGCGSTERTMPRCEPDERLGLVAQSVPAAAYLPCVDELPPGWSIAAYEVRDGRTSFWLRSDRAREPVRVQLVPECETDAATPVTPRGEGVRTLQLVTAISPSYVGSLFDVFPGGCVIYRFEFRRGPHLALMEELQQAVGLFPRRELRQALRARLGVDLVEQ